MSWYIDRSFSERWLSSDTRPLAAQTVRVQTPTLVVWGRQDPHVPFAGRETIRARLEEVGARYEWHEVNAAHAFLRDEGPRYDPTLFLQLISWVLALFQRALGASP